MTAINYLTTITMSYQEYKVDPYVRIWNRLADGGEICSGGFDPKNDPDDRRKLLLIILGAVAFVLMFVMFSGCSRKVYVPVERTTTVYETLRDTLIEVELKEVRDTVTVETLGGDTLSYLSNDLAYSFASIEGGKLGHSLGVRPGTKVWLPVQMPFIHIIDSIPYPVTVEVEKKLTWWQSLKMEYGGFAMGLAAALAFFVWLLILRERKRE